MRAFAVVGSRSFNDYDKLYDILHKHIMPYVKSGIPVRIVSGGATGADTMAERFAEECGIEYWVIRPDWKGQGSNAGFLRNITIIDSSDEVVALWDGTSGGTAHTITQAILRGRKVTVYSMHKKTPVKGWNDVPSRS